MAVETLEIPRKIIDVYKEQGYHFVGKQAVIKPCHWFRRALLTNGREYCYKQKFYGIPTHRCLQMSPIIQCNLRCVFCWRTHPSDIGVKWDETKVVKELLDDPREIVRRALEEHVRMLSGYIGNYRISRRFLEEAMRPVHAAISLTGEPTMYPYLGDLIKEFFRQGFKSVFVVTNGTYPEALENLDTKPSQLYMTLIAPDKETYLKTAKPAVKDAWERTLRSLEVLRTYNVPTVIRLTLVKGVNLKDPKKYAKLIEIAEPTYVEPKAAMSIGYFLKRLDRSAMPSHDDIRKFAEELAKELGYYIIDEHLPSRIVLLSKRKRPAKLLF